MGRSRLVLLALLFLAGSLAGCSRSGLGPRACQDGQCACIFKDDCPEGFDCVDAVCVEEAFVDAGPEKKGFGELCGGNEECWSGYCLPDLQGAFCSILCSEGCPEGWACRLVIDPRGEPDLVGLCVVDRDILCQACLDDADCNPSGGDRCLELAPGGAPHCARDCTFEDCPAGYACTEVTPPEGEPGRQCLPGSGTCDCGADSEGQVRGCLRQNDLGTCSGQEVCRVPEGWAECSASEPAQETCNGIDDDCEGRVDEGLAPRPCTATAGTWTCEGTETCAGERGWVCDAPVPEAEACDGVDNNCDGAIDEDFLNEDGLYFRRAHCGGCGVDCNEIIAHATATRCVIREGASRCIATACETGYFPHLEGTICLELPDTLCDSCSSDEDCVAPGSRCVDNGEERFCGRDCAAGSPYGRSCPTDYACEPHAGGSQCQPISDTCLCSAENVGTRRACNVSFCQGFETCAASGGDFDWSSCDISSIVEICNGEDNDCDGEIDEGFLNQATGRYDTDAHCGFCNNDCNAYWVPEIHHATGSCNAALGFPECGMGACLTERIAGVDYEWVDVNGDDLDGCECRRVLGNTTVDAPDRGAFPAPGAEYVDENCDGTDGVVQDSLFVWGGNSAPGNGTIGNPYRTIGQALGAFPTSGKATILVAEGTYPENVVLFDGVQLHGGYASDFRSREILIFTTVIQAVAPSGSTDLGAVSASGLGHGAQVTVVAGFHLQGRNLGPGTPDNQDGSPSYALYLRGAGPGLEIQNNVIRAGHAGAGGRGSTGAVGFGRQASATLDGRAGIDSVPVNGACPAGLLVAGGNGGTNATCAPAVGSAGGSAVCPSFDWSATPIQGSQQEHTAPLGNNGPGGFDWSYDNLSGFDCSHATESGWPTNIQTNTGGDGQDGQDGTAGPGGGGCAGGYGSVSGLVWVPATASSTRGGGGATGSGAGGGGAGGGTARFPAGGCNQHEQGASGGGGGAGGCGGGGGRPGRAGGAAIAIFASYSSPTGTARLPLVSDNRIRRGFGGRGGPGGFGGPGGQGGNGAFGGFPGSWSASSGGKGGDGGNGGPGGGGGGGCGGPSFGILGYNVQGATWESDNLFDLDATVDTGGPAGPGGGTAGQSSFGAPGTAGAFDNAVYLRPCGAGGSCPASRSCDANGVCIPDN